MSVPDISVALMLSMKIRNVNRSHIAVLCITTENFSPPTVCNIQDNPLTRVTGLLFGFLTLVDGADRLSRNVGNKLPAVLIEVFVHSGMNT
jgi:hypothetical protein